MPLLARTVATPLVVEVGAGTVAGLPDILRDRRISPGGDVAFVLGPGQGEEVARQLRLRSDEKRSFVVRSASVADAETMASAVRENHYDAIVGIGGGRTLDVAKWVGTRLGVPTVSVATSLAHDGIASPVAVLEHGRRKGSYGVQIPLAVVVDTDFVRRSDVRVTRAGVGDVLSNLSAIADWELARAVRGEPLDGLAVAMARTAATSVMDADGNATDGRYLQVLAEALVLSGLAMAVAGNSRPCSGACHEISHALDEMSDAPRSLHGEQVAVGALFATFLRDDEDGFVRLGDAMRRAGLPMDPEGLGLSPARFTQAVLAAPSTRPGRFTVLEHAGLDRTGAERAVSRFVAAVAARWAPAPSGSGLPAGAAV